MCSSMLWGKEKYSPSRRHRRLVLLPSACTALGAKSAVQRAWGSRLSHAADYSHQCSVSCSTRASARAHSTHKQKKCAPLIFWP